MNNKNPREARAHKMLSIWQEDGYSFRHTITEALLRLEDSGSKSTTINLKEFNEKLSQVIRLLERIENEYYVSENQDEDYPLPILTEMFIASIKKAAKPGMMNGESGS